MNSPPRTPDYTGIVTLKSGNGHPYDLYFSGHNSGDKQLIEVVILDTEGRINLEGLGKLADELIQDAKIRELDSELEIFDKSFKVLDDYTLLKYKAFWNNETQKPS